MSRIVIGTTWEESSPHLTEQAKSELLASYQPYIRDARTKGIPQLGAGAVYPFPESDIRVPDMPIPDSWRRGFGLDCALSGVTAAVWGALDVEAMVLYIYSVYRRSQAETVVHAEAIKSRGLWIPGVGDAAGVLDVDRSTYIQRYRANQIDLELPDKSVEPGIQDVYDCLSNGKLKVFASCEQWFAEFRLYRREEKKGQEGKIVKQNDHLMDATRYLVRSGRARMKTKPVEKKPRVEYYDGGGSQALGWMR